MNAGMILAAAARHHPDRTAFVWEGANGPHRMTQLRYRTYREANERAETLAVAMIDELDLGPGDRVGLLMWNSPEILETMFAVWRAGATVVPLNARFTDDEVVFHLNDAGARVLVAGSEFAVTAQRVRPRLTTMKHVVVAGRAEGDETPLGDLLARHEGRRPTGPATADEDVAWLVYTSGTTGRPKAAMLTHGVLTFTAVSWLADLHRLEPEDVGLHAAPLTHGAGLHALALTMKACTQVILQPSGFDPGRFLDTVERHRVTNTWLVPTQIKMLLQHPRLEAADLTSLKGIVYGGAPMYVEDLKEAIRRIGPVFTQIFAQAETPMTGTYLRAEEHAVDGDASIRLSSCGHARSGVEVQVVDEQDNPLPPGETGEICIRGPAVMKGYWERPDATAEAVRGGWLHTGDIGRMDEHGYFYILDRAKDMVISGGLNIYPREIEEVLLRHPDVAQVAVIGVPDEHWGEALKAVVVPLDGKQPTGAEITEFAGRHLAGYKKPKSIDFVAELPKNAYGKVDKKLLRAPHWAGRERMVN